MSETLTLQGNIDNLPELLRTVMSNQGIVSLRLKRDALESTFYFEDGKIVSAITNDPDFHLPEILFTKGEIDYETYVKIQEYLRKKMNLVSALQESGALSPDDFLRAMEMQVQEILNFTLRWISGTYTVSFLEKLPENLLPLRTNTERLILNAIRQIQRFSSVKKGIGSFQKYFIKTPEQDARLYKIELKDEENYILGLFEERKSISEVLNLSYLSNFETLKIIWGLFVLNFIKEELEEDRSKTEEREKEYLKMAMLESYNNAFSTIYKELYQLEGEDAELLLNEAMAKLSPEYKKIISGNILSLDGRFDYDMITQYLYKEKIQDHLQFLQDFLNEVLYSWILLIRLKYGNKLEDVLEKAISEIRET
ncbi:MAG: DUF4388 domain-containing protein [Thermoanaerobaculia bacterium]